jgi:formylglycine-generating enzyme required for sulfatase activity
MRFAAGFPCAVLLISLGVAAGYAEKRVAPMIGGDGVHIQGAQVTEVAPSSADPCGAAEAVAASLSARSAMPLCAAEERLLKPMDTFMECDKCPEMIVVPAGSFNMGSPRNEPEKRFDEDPQHQVTIGNAFAVGKFAVTFDEWDACVADGGCNGYRPLDEGWGRNRRPVINVSWNDTKAYVAWLSHKTGKGYRLLSEAEREYVTRAGTTTSFWWGSSITPRQANYDGSFAYNKGEKGENRNKTVPVDSFTPNPWGLYEVHGNVWEWVEDCWHKSYQGAPTDGTAWTNAARDCTSRVLRGGSWSFLPKLLRAAARDRSTAGYRSSLHGFRVGRTLLPS